MGEKSDRDSGQGEQLVMRSVLEESGGAEVTGKAVQGSKQARLSRKAKKRQAKKQQVKNEQSKGQPAKEQQPKKDHAEKPQAKKEKPKKQPVKKEQRPKKQQPKKDGQRQQPKKQPVKKVGQGQQPKTEQLEKPQAKKEQPKTEQLEKPQAKTEQPKKQPVKKDGQRQQPKKQPVKKDGQGQQPKKDQLEKPQPKKDQLEKPQPKTEQLEKPQAKKEQPKKQQAPFDDHASSTGAGDSSGKSVGSSKSAMPDGGEADIGVASESWIDSILAVATQNTAEKYGSSVDELAEVELVDEQPLVEVDEIGGADRDVLADETTALTRESRERSPSRVRGEDLDVDEAEVAPQLDETQKTRDTEKTRDTQPAPARRKQDNETDRQGRRSAESSPERRRGSGLAARLLVGVSICALVAGLALLIVVLLDRGGDGEPSVEEIFEPDIVESEQIELVRQCTSNGFTGVLVSSRGETATVRLVVKFATENGDSLHQSQLSNIELQPGESVDVELPLVPRLVDPELLGQPFTCAAEVSLLPNS